MKKNLVILCFGIMLASVSNVSAALITWTDWTRATIGASGSVDGSMGGVGVTYNGDVTFTQLNGGTNYWSEGNPAPYTGSAVVDNAPTPGEMIALSRISTNTITFSEAVYMPIMTIVSMGRRSLPVSYAFDQSFNLLSQGVGYWGSDSSGVSISGNTLTGNEFHGAIQFDGLVSSVTFSVSPGEYWHGITVGTAGSVPEPATMLLFGTALIGLAGLGRKRYLKK